MGKNEKFSIKNGKYCKIFFHEWKVKNAKNYSASENSSETCTETFVVFSIHKWFISWYKTRTTNISNYVRLFIGTLSKEMGDGSE